MFSSGFGSSGFGSSGFGSSRYTSSPYGSSMKFSGIMPFGGASGFCCPQVCCNPCALLCCQPTKRTSTTVRNRNRNTFEDDLIPIVEDYGDYGDYVYV
ncbi:unnamed protein product [Adineta steineri]|uniref:Uncharacterized protein n=1 Tax=Adineta steineri TaxID=433720 RepID=A0A815U453_9BILA|nr:unnamed protein product [Adineta steineri]CAF1487958.1 unnamed protein product [Adineta steineri]CAF1511236.1 unnamed protein product [Adineta steineri]CAF1563721.1 unnamed protein product [Adineta steineri]CAF3938540.1 unnamed protein product [Adineta steineri]